MKSNFSLNDKYLVTKGLVFMSGIQALLKLALLQKQIDEKQGLNTGGFISGYRGSPLGGLDQTLWNQKDLLAKNDIVFQPGVNEELAATACWGTQQLHLNPDKALKDGVFSFWYAKGPGVDRSVDVLKHANMAGTSPLGGVVAIAGDDHVSKSSSIAHQSDHVFKACGIPVFFPSSVQEIIDFGLHAVALSRFAGLWTSIKTIQEVVESSSCVNIDIENFKVNIPDFKTPEKGLHIRWPDTPLEQEARLMDYKWYAALAYIRENNLNKLVYNTQQDTFGIISSGKAYNDTLQALADLGLDEQKCNQLGIRLYKVGVVWPLEPHGAREFAQGLNEILVVEEKRQLIEYQLKEQLYGWRADVRPNILGKFDEMQGDYSGGEWTVENPSDHWLLSAKADLCSLDIAKAIYTRLSKQGLADLLKNPFECSLSSKTAIHAGNRPPWFCSGCPHNTSTKVPKGSIALAGIGCHYMAQWMDRDTQTFSQMGGEGVSWVGQAPFSKTDHVFANLGDGTYYHSGLLAIRQSISAKVNITYKILYNNAVAMTGGQPVEGGLSVYQIAQELHQEGVSKIVLVTDDPSKYSSFPFGVYPRQKLMEVQEELKCIKGCTVLIYDQMCATEKRRQIKRKQLEPALKRTVINSSICEGCGDCSEKSNCVSIEPLQTIEGVKRTINQSSCNEDLSCVQGFCPSFVLLENAKLIKPSMKKEYDLEAIEVKTPEFKNSDNKILFSGIGGTGVITLGQILGVAAFIDDKKVVVQEASGLAQKGGATWCHVQISDNKDILTTKIPKNTASLIFAADLVVASQKNTLEFSGPRTHWVLNIADTPTAEFTLIKDHDFNKASLLSEFIKKQSSHVLELDFSKASKTVFNDAIYSNMIQLGYCFQAGFISIDEKAIVKAIEINKTNVVENTRAFKLGRILYENPEFLQTKKEYKPIVFHKLLKPNEVLEHYRQKFKDYQDEAYFQKFLTIYQEYESILSDQLKIELLNNLARVFLVKDEYEVSRLLALNNIETKEFEPGFKSYFYIAPPFLGTRKIKVPTRFKPLFKITASFKFLRGTFMDPFRYQKERIKEQSIKKEYIELLNLLKTSSISKEDMVKVIKWPEYFKGFGHVKFSKETLALEQKRALIKKHNI